MPELLPIGRPLYTYSFMVTSNTVLIVFGGQPRSSTVTVKMYGKAWA